MLSKLVISDSHEGCGLESAQHDLAALPRPPRVKPEGTLYA